MLFSESIKSVLQAGGISQGKLAKSMGVSQPAIAKFVNSNNPGISVACRLMNILGYDVVLVPKTETVKLSSSCYILEAPTKQTSTQEMGE